MNITVPDELKGEMDLLEGVNWSRVAQDAFTSEVSIRKHRLKGDDMQAGLERLAAAKRSDLDFEYEDGFSTGKKWALEEAEFRQLKRIIRLIGQEGYLPSQDVDSNVLALLAGAIDGDDDLSWHAVVDVLEGALGDGEPTDQRVSGFIDAVKEVFDQIP